ncbi:MAG TPA: DUF411 domain-containing protein [Burkholderiales bacterium]|nr:DUF411 domain-containing protein [Burkholderiales bacterium]
MAKIFSRAAAIALLSSASAIACAAQTVTVYKDAGCGCCKAWVKHLEANGFRTQVHDVTNMPAHKHKLRVPERLGSCHTAVVDGYTIEGHVPAADIKRLLAARPKARGLAVPGMPEGSPGMETGKVDAYDVLLFSDDGRSSVYSRHGRP